ncbi:MAG TPA: DUF692 domain-containing protein [Pyrinomonadaceae bacterium]|nr:DUF692 domain-containing protein [Pyrinomonadaceae bacterium]
MGVGVGFRAPFRGELFLHREEINFLEIIADHYLDTSPEKERELDLLAEHFTLVPHALNLSLGSAEGLDASYLSKLSRLINRLNPPWWSEHISFTKAGGVDIGHLAPLPYTHEAVDALCRNIAEVRRHITAPLILENVTYMLRVPGGEMDEAQFITEVLERADCGLLLDVTNLHTNAVNHGYDPVEFLDRLSPGRIVQLHFVGGSWHEGVLIDCHSQPTPDEVWALMEKVCERAPIKGVVLERDENLPPFAEMLAELERARFTGRRYGRWA